jgi:hypothetical protein
VLLRHLKSVHGYDTRQLQLTDHIEDGLAFQSWMLGDIHSSWVVCLDGLQADKKIGLSIAPAVAATEAACLFTEKLYTKERKYLLENESRVRQEPDSITLNPALMANWMRRTGWEKTFHNADRGLVVALSALPFIKGGRFVYDGGSGITISPAPNDEQRLVLIIAALDRLFDRCADTVRHTDVSMCRWLRGRYPHRPYKAPFELVTPK